MSPVAKDAALCFAMRRGEITRSLHADYYHPERINAVAAIKTNWANQTKTLGNVIKFSDSLATYQSGKYYIGLANVESDFGAYVETSVSEPKGTCRLFKKGQILYGKLRPYLNKVFVPNQDGQSSTEFFVFDPKSPDELDRSYLVNYLTSKVFLSQTIHMMTGNTHPRIQQDDFEEILIPLPPIETQRVFVKELESARKVHHLKLSRLS